MFNLEIYFQNMIMEQGLFQNETLIKIANDSMEVIYGWIAAIVRFEEKIEKN